MSYKGLKIWREKNREYHLSYNRLWKKIKLLNDRLNADKIKLVGLLEEMKNLKEKSNKRKQGITLKDFKPRGNELWQELTKEEKRWYEEKRVTKTE